MIISWVIFNVIVLTILVLDLFVFHRKAHKVRFGEALVWSAVWIALALVFNFYVYMTMGREAGINFLTGYLIEKSLSVDNLFVFIMIFTYFHTPESLLHKVMFWGVLGAIISRALFILVGVTLVQKFHPIIYLFGLFLVVTGIRLAVKRQGNIHPEKNLIIRLLRYIFPVTSEYEGDRFFIKKNSKIYVTPLGVVLLAIESTDIIFAVDSIPAILAITYDPFIVYTSNIFAILGLRALFFLLAGSLKLFKYLHYGISVVLIFVGIKMLLSDFIYISPFVALAVVFSVLIVSILASILLKDRQ